MDLIQKGLYLLQEEKFIETNKTIYKIGKSDNIYSRVNQYPNGTIVYLIIESDNITKHETELIRIFTQKYKQIRYYGYEYFDGNLDSMKQSIIDYIKTNSILENIKIINQSIKIERVNRDTNLPIPKYTQELYTKPKLDIIKNIKDNTNIVEKIIDINIIENLVETEDNNLSENAINIEDTNLSENAIKTENCNVSDNNNLDIDSAKTCNICGKSFDYPYLVDRHKNGIRKCHKKNNNINITITVQQNNKLINNNIKKINCSHCNNKFASKYSLERHYNVCKLYLLKKATVDNNENDKFNKLVSIINDLIVDNRKLVNEYKNQLLTNK